MKQVKYRKTQVITEPPQPAILEGGARGAGGWGAGGGRSSRKDRIVKNSLKRPREPNRYPSVMSPSHLPPQNELTSFDFQGDALRSSQDAFWHLAPKSMRGEGLTRSADPPTRRPFAAAAPCRTCLFVCLFVCCHPPPRKPKPKTGHGPPKSC